MHSRLKKHIVFHYNNAFISADFVFVYFANCCRLTKTKKKNAIIYPQREKVNTTCMAHLVSQKVWKLFSTSRIKKKACPYRCKKQKKKDSPK